jgi:hypothetical protein
VRHPRLAFGHCSEAPHRLVVVRVGPADEVCGGTAAAARQCDSIRSRRRSRRHSHRHSHAASTAATHTPPASITADGIRTQNYTAAVLTLAVSTLATFTISVAVADPSPGPARPGALCQCQSRRPGK